MIKVGAVDIDTSHPRTFGQIMEETGRAKYTAVYNEGFRGEDEIDGFMEMFGAEKKCRSISELVDAVDIGFVHSCNWDRHLKHAEAFISAGKPVFIDKPLAGNPADLARFEEAARKGAVILGSSSVRYAGEIEAFSALPAGERGEPVCVSGSCGVDEFNYGVHIVEAIGGLLGKGAISTRFCGRAAKEGKKCETFIVNFSGGETAVYNNFSGAWHPFDMTIMTSKNTFNFRVDNSKIYRALLERIFDFLETGKNRLAGVDELAESVRIMLAGKISREQGGGEIKLSSIPAGYAGFDGSEFEAEYSKKASKLFSEKEG